mmetsp:Transcript_75779/g.214230  ORF Transcript_75779/g.214230 Transcript_75779/m.214230 type:complete len:314 (-) Transcript_75779:38-979(-)
MVAKACICALSDWSSTLKERLVSSFVRSFHWSATPRPQSSTGSRRASTEAQTSASSLGGGSWSSDGGATAPLLPTGMPRRSARVCCSASSSPRNPLTSPATPSTSLLIAGSDARNASLVLPTGSRWPMDRAPSRWMRSSSSPLQTLSSSLSRSASPWRLATSVAEGVLMISRSFRIWPIMLSYSSSSSLVMLKPPAATPRAPPSPSLSSSSAFPSSGASLVAAGSSPKTSCRFTLRPLYFASTGVPWRSRRRPFSGRDALASSPETSTEGRGRALAAVSSPSPSTSAGSKDSGAALRLAILSAIPAAMARRRW